MWLRLIILIALLYLLYRIFRPRKSKEEARINDRLDSPHEDVMVQDPYCKVYVPRSQAIEMRWGSEDLFFCSKECKERFLEVRRGGNTDR